MPRNKTKKEGGKVYEMTRFIYKCELCKDVIESTSREHVGCKCGNLSISGGIYYGGLISCLEDYITDLSEWKLVE
jgi:hypothetical protein